MQINLSGAAVVVRVVSAAVADEVVAAGSEAAVAPAGPEDGEVHVAPAALAAKGQVGRAGLTSPV